VGKVRNEGMEELGEGRAEGGCGRDGRLRIATLVNGRAADPDRRCSCLNFGLQYLFEGGKACEKVGVHWGFSGKYGGEDAGLSRSGSTSQHPYTMTFSSKHWRQGFRIMLPVSKQLHENMQESRYLRAFYVLGGSVHDALIDSNCVRVMCIIANNLRTADDDAELDSPVNITASQREIRFVAISLPVLDSNGDAIITCHRNEGIPVYKYLKEISLVRA